MGIIKIDSFCMHPRAIGDVRILGVNQAFIVFMTRVVLAGQVVRVFQHVDRFHAPVLYF